METRGQRVFRIDDDLKNLIESGVAVVIGTTDAARKPNVNYCWGPRVLNSRHSLHLFLECSRATPTRENLEQTGAVAITVADPITYRSVQLKGRHITTEPATDEDLAWVQRHREAFSSATALTGDSPGVRRNAWMEDALLRFEVEISAAFDQTPGPNAGRPL
ncbi:MAG: pyridoxamine 5'-phosphate oxidase family protein [Tepidiformaceae bacterium]